MKNLVKLFFILFLWCFTSCFAKEDYVFYGTETGYYEIGYDSNNRVYFTDTRSKIQIAYICEGAPYGNYSKEDLLKHFHVDENATYTEMGDYLNKMEIESCIYVAEGKEEIYSKHFKSQITRYYVTYKNVYDHFHM